MTDPITTLFDTFAAQGKELYLVGGAVRDLLLGERPADYDFTTDARPEEMIAMFPKVVTLGQHFGTIGVVLAGEVFEITTYRREGGYRDGRHPSALTFSDDVRDDVKRRDFTINGLLMDRHGTVFDYVGGLKDLDAGIIRVIGDPAARFGEDKLRKWRCCRLAAEKAFEIDEATMAAIAADPDTTGVSGERIRVELNRLVLSAKPTWGGYNLIKSGLYDELMHRIVPSFAQRGHEVFLDAFELLAYLPRVLTLRLAALLINMDEAERGAFMGALAYAGAVKNEVNLFLTNARLRSDDPVAFKTALRNLTPAQADHLFALQGALGKWLGLAEMGERAQKNRAELARITAAGEPLHLRDLAVDSQDLMALGYRGKALGQLQQELLRHVYTHPGDNNAAALKKIAKGMAHG